MGAILDQLQDAKGKVFIVLNLVFAVIDNRIFISLLQSSPAWRNKLFSSVKIPFPVAEHDLQNLFR